jgi:RNA polymerase sigma-70 factor (ECF subfamily)
MLHSGQDYQRGTVFDIWAFRQLHGDWLTGLRSHESPLAQGQADAALFSSVLEDEEEEGHLAETAEILSRLPPQQRSAVLLVYGEGFSYDEAAEILDTTPQTVIARVARALASFIERAHWLDSARLSSAEVQQINQINRQAG